MTLATDTERFRALVDMGSNGIRFSISDLSPSTARLLPVIYQGRSSISLYDAQYSGGEKVDLPATIIQDVLSALQRFKRTCKDFQVPEQQVRLVATEATRNANNSVDFLGQIERELGWKPQLLSKEEEGRLGAFGVASSLHDLHGLVIDMGGGSMQLSFVSTDSEHGIQIGLKGSISVPLGAASLMARISKANNRHKLREAIVEELRKAIKQLDIPSAHSVNMYLSGGGFRGWGHMLMETNSVSGYPIPLVNGYVIEGSHFAHITSLSDTRPDSHRISKRRASQSPAVQLAIEALLDALRPRTIKQVTFCQGGVREGILYSELPKEIQLQHPLNAATKPHSPRSSPEIVKMLENALPKQDELSSFIIEATVDLLYTHASYPKDICASSALRSTTSGLLATTHGLLHQERALLALILCERYGGKIPAVDRPFYESLEKIVGVRANFWAKYLGCVASSVAEVYPAGIMPEGSVYFDVSGKTVDSHSNQVEEVAQSSEAQSNNFKPMLPVEVAITIKDNPEQAGVLAKRLKKLGKKGWWTGELGESFSNFVEVSIVNNDNH